MIDSKPYPSRLLRRLATAARWAFGLLLAAWLVLLTSGVVLHGFIVPRIGDWRSKVEVLASHVVGAPVEIAAISARSEGWLPTFELAHVTIHAPEGREALRLPKVVVALSARSLLRRGVEQLFIEAPSLDVRRLRDGTWQVAGLAVAGRTDGDGAALQWLLAQPEVVVRGGQVLWTDELRGQAPTAFRAVDMVLRAGIWRHALRLDATPVEGGSVQKLHVAGIFRAPLLRPHAQVWQRWSGEWYTEVQLAQLPHLPWPQAWPVAKVNAQGGVRMWGQVEHGQVVGATTDVALAQAHVQWKDTALPPLVLQALQGRVQAQVHAGGWQFAAQDVTLTTADHQVWPRSHWALKLSDPAQAEGGTELRLDAVDLHVLASLATRLPLDPAVRAGLARWAPAGVVRQLQLHWQPGHYKVSGELQEVQLQAQPHSDPAQAGTPGFAGLSGQFALTEAGGQAQLQMAQGSLHFPGVFEEPVIPVEHLQAKLQWQHTGEDWRLDITDMAFRNADAQGHMTATWHTGETADNRFPGILQLQGRLLRAEGTRVHRYLPQVIPASARHYVRDSVRAGVGRDVRFEVRGDLRDMPFERPGSGRFHIEAPLQHVDYDYVPAALNSPGSLPWPGLQQLQGLLVFDGASMEVRNATAVFGPQPAVHMARIAAQIPHLSEPILTVQARGQGPLQHMLDLVQQSPLAQMTGHALDQAQAQGRSALAFDLTLPIHDLDHSKVQGQVGFQRNSLRLGPEVPEVQQLQGAVAFHEQGFALQDVRGHSLGGSVQLGGGMAHPEAPVHITAQGVATDQGLRADMPLQVVQRVAQHAQGQARYRVDVAVVGGVPDVQVESDLQGMALALPAPLGKAGAQSWPLAVRYGPAGDGQMQQRVVLGEQLLVDYRVQTQGLEGQVQRGVIAIGDRSKNASVPKQGVDLLLQLSELDGDAWARWWQANGPGAEIEGADQGAAAASYAPNRVVVQLGHLQWRQRALGAVDLTAQQDQGVWRAHIASVPVAGSVIYHPASVRHAAGLLQARLQHLHVPQAAVERLEPRPVEAAQDVHSLPAVDIEVQDVVLEGKALGQLQLQARNQMAGGRSEWWLERFDVTMPEAQWHAHGRWAAAAQWGAQRSTALDFQLQVHDAGRLLARLGMPDVLRDGKGIIQGQLQWQGSPVSPHAASMQGQLQLAMGKGQFLKVEPGMGKLLSVLSLQSLSRRATLDFRDVFGQGFAFDFVRGDVDVEAGVARTHNLQMKGLNAAVLLEGQASLPEETQDLRVVVVPEINAMTASLVATAINPVVGVSTFVAQMLLRGTLMEAATRTFAVSGTWSDPVVLPIAQRASDQAPGGITPP